MANLAQWQKISRVMPGLPFGNGSDGAYSSATIPTITYRSCNGTATSTILTLGVAGFANGDVILIHQTRGTGVGQWEINQISYGGGSTSLTLRVPLNYTYTDSGSSQAQAIKILMYTTVDPSSGIWTVTGWDGDKGGILPIAAKLSFVPTNTINLTSVGYLGGSGYNATSSIHTSYQGEGTSGARDTASNLANGSGGGGGDGGNPGRCGGGGGGHATSGSNGTAVVQDVGLGGETGGSADLVTMIFGGGGGSGGADLNDASNGGARGGGILVVFGKDIDISSATINVDGGNGAAESEAGGGGGGAGGSALFVCQMGTFGTNKVTVAIGIGGVSAAQGDGGDGSVGRIAVHHSGTITGSSNPSFTDVTDGTLVENTGGYIM